MLTHQLSAVQLQLVEAQSTINLLEAPKVQPTEEGSEETPLVWWRSWWLKLTS
jgi:hypothetical protein